MEKKTTNWPKIIMFGSKTTPCPTQLPTLRELLSTYACIEHTQGYSCSRDKGLFEELKHEMQPTGRASALGKATSSLQTAYDQGKL